MVQHEAMERLSLLAHVAAQNSPGSSDIRGDQVLAALLDQPAQLREIVGDLLASEIWRENVLPDTAAALLRALDDAADRRGFATAWLRLYFALFHEAAALNFLELLLFNGPVAEVRGRQEGDRGGVCHHPLHRPLTRLAWPPL